MTKFVFLTVGFLPPTPEIMAAWGEWFESIKDHIVDKGHLSNGREISKNGVKELPMDLEAITGFMVVEAEDLQEAQKMAEGNPYITSIRVYEMMEG